MKTGQIWQRCDSVLQHRVILLGYLGDDWWKIEFHNASKYSAGGQYHDVEELVASINGEIKGEYLYRHYICVEDPDRYNETRGNMD